jgi:UDPglucose 6-dehydrogenase
MKPVIGFADIGELGENSASAAHHYGFERHTWTPGKTGDLVTDLSNCDVVYVCPDRPGRNTPEGILDILIPHLRPDAILVILCQVMPGFTRNVDWPKEQLYYQVETLRKRDALDRAIHPERIIMGCHNPLMPIAAPLMAFLRAFGCPVLPMDYESAELAKIAINLYLVAQLSTTNMLADIADRIGADWNDIIPTLQTDKRIGPEAYLLPGGGFGPHLERDIKTIALLAEKIGVKIFNPHA